MVASYIPVVVTARYPEACQSAAINAGTETNRLELACADHLIAARVNGVEIGAPEELYPFTKGPQAFTQHLPGVTSVGTNARYTRSSEDRRTSQGRGAYAIDMDQQR